MKINYAKVPGSGSVESVKSGSQIAEAGRKMLASAGIQTHGIEATPPKSSAGSLAATPIANRSPVTPDSQTRLFEAGVKRVSLGSRFGDNDAAITLTEGDIYASRIPDLPGGNMNRQVDQTRLREIRRKFDGHCSAKEIEALLKECLHDAVEICSGEFIC
jgi:hypothetical protein